MIMLDAVEISLSCLQLVKVVHKLLELWSWDSPSRRESYYQISVEVFPHQIIIIMRRQELNYSLLSSSANFIQDKHSQTQEEQMEQDLRRLQRKIVKELPERKIVKPQIVAKGMFCGTVLNPHSRLIIAWYVLNIFLTYLYFIEVPIAVGFDKKENQKLFSSIINFPVIFIFLMDIFINFDTSFYQDGELQTNPHKIKIHYLTTSFAFDVISLIAIFLFEIASAFDLEQTYNYLRYTFIIFFVRFQKVVRLQKVVLIQFDLNRRTKALFKIILLLVQILFVCNLVASGGFMLSSYLSQNVQILNKNNSACGDPCYWVTNVTQGDINLKNQAFNVQYVYALYWASTTMISIGYGDITPKNSYQVTYTVIIQFLSCLLYAYSINQIWNIMLQLNKKKTRINSRISTINLYMRDKEIGPELNSKVNGYLINYYYAKNLRERQVQNQIIAELTPSLKRQLFYQSYSILFRQKYFVSMTDKVIMFACQNVKQVCCYEDQTLSPRDFSPSPCLFFIKKGEFLQRYGEFAKVKIRSQYKGDYIGLYQFITQLSFLSQLTAIQYSLAYYIKYQYMRSALLEDRRCFQYFYLTKQSMMLYSQLGRIGHLCYFCSLRDHRTQFCFDYKLRKQVKRLQENFKRSQDQHRKPQFARRKFNIKIGEKRMRKKSFSKANNQLFLLKKDRFHHFSLMSQMEIMDDLKPQRKWSVVEQLQLKRGGKFFIKPRYKHENHMLQTVRENYANKSDTDSNKSFQSEEIKLREIDIDILAQYQEYYPKFNCSQLNPKQILRRRMIKSFYF